VKKYRPTIGFSIKEAKQAARVTLIGGSQSFPDTVLEELRSANCTVEQISGDGTSIASQLATL
jgi:putative cell wall-binding protein